VISTAGTGNDSVKALVFIGGFAPEAGESATDLAGRYEGGTPGETLAAVKLPDGGTDLYIKQDRYHAQFAADSSPGEAAILAVTQRPITESALTEPSGEPAWKTIPSWFLFGTEDNNIPAAAQRFMAERAGSRRTVELQGGSHAVAIPQAAAVVELIREAATGGAAR
jgi:pimeloyl-ACP methyl ester carboxylesterase